MLFFVIDLPVLAQGRSRFFLVVGVGGEEEEGRWGWKERSWRGGEGEGGKELGSGGENEGKRKEGKGRKGERGGRVRRVRRGKRKE